MQVYKLADQIERNKRREIRRRAREHIIEQACFRALYRGEGSRLRDVPGFCFFDLPWDGGLDKVPSEIKTAFFKAHEHLIPWYLSDKDPDYMEKFEEALSRYV